MKKQRIAKVARKTKETEIKVQIDLNGAGRAEIKTPFGFLNHLLESFAKHGLLDLKIIAKGDTQIDEHHTIEDIGIVLGQALKKALAKPIAINRFASAIIPMDDALARVALDLSARPYLVYQVSISKKRQWEFNVNLIEDFFRALAFNAGITLHIKLEYGKDYHHCLEAIFKAFGIALRHALNKNPGVRSFPSTKGKL